MSLIRLLGSPPINPVVFAASKLALVTIVVGPALQLIGVPIRRPVPGLLPVAAALLLASVTLLVWAGRSLGLSTRVGLPTDQTTLKTSGVYRFSRHPMYVSMFLLALASSLYCPHPLVLAAAVVVVVVHHRIAIAEEAFLERRFGQAWLDHKARVPRYAGVPRRESLQRGA